MSWAKFKVCNEFGDVLFWASSINTAMSYRSYWGGWIERV